MRLSVIGCGYLGAVDAAARASIGHVSTLTHGCIVVDGRNGWDAAAWRAAGWTYYGMGRP